MDDLKSTSGYTFTLDTGLFSWASNKHNSMALSTAEAEYVSAYCYFSSNLANKIELYKIEVRYKFQQHQFCVISSLQLV